MKFPRPMLSDLARSGLTRADAGPMQLEFIPAGDERLTKVFPRLKADAYAIPYFEITGKVNGFARYKLLGDYTPKGADKPAKYLQPPDTEPDFYFAPFLDWKSIAADKTPLFIVEGEKKAAAMAKLGIAAIGIGGVSNFSSDGVPIKAFFNAGINWNRDVGIVFDSDKHFNRNVMGAQERLAKLLKELGANPFAVDLPLSGHGKVGADDFIVQHGRKARAAFDALPKTWLFMAPSMELQTLLATNIPETEYIVKGLFPVGVTLLVGGPKVGKSAFIYDGQISATRGEPILEQFETQPTECCYVALEDTDKRLKVRAELLMKARSRDAKLGKLKPVPEPTKVAPLHLHTEWARDPADAVLAIERKVKQFPGIKLFVFDTFAKLTKAPAANVNAYRADYDAITPLKRIADKYRIAIVLVHHTRKAADAEDVLNEINGSNGLAGAADSILILKRKRTESDGTLYITGRDVEERQLAVRYSYPRWASLGDAQAHRLSLDRREVLEVLVHEPKGLTRTDLARAIKKKYQAARYLVDRLKDDGLITVNEKGVYTLTGTGEMCLKGGAV